MSVRGGEVSLVGSEPERIVAAQVPREAGGQHERRRAWPVAESLQVGPRGSADGRRCRCCSFNFAPTLALTLHRVCGGGRSKIATATVSCCWCCCCWCC